MITFKDFLTESRSAPLYHATSLLNAKKIIDSNTLIPRSDVTDAKTRSLSFTRLFRTAWKFGIYVATSRSTHRVVVFEVDQTKLSQNYKLEPFQFWSQPMKAGRSYNKARLTPRDEDLDDGMFNEFEERVVGRSIRNFMKYVTKIIVYSPASFKGIDPAIVKTFMDTGKVEYLTQLPMNKYSQ